MKIIETIGNARSGHHAMLNWIISNLCGQQVQNWGAYNMTHLNNSTLSIFDEVNYKPELNLNWLKDQEDHKTVILNYVDAFPNYTLLYGVNNVFKGPYAYNKNLGFTPEYKGRILMIRDFYSNLLSRLKGNKVELQKIVTDTGSVTDETFMFDVSSHFIDVWKSQAKACIENQISFIKYEDWMYNKEIRQNFLWDNFQVKEQFNNANIKGTNSSYEIGEKRNNIELLPNSLKQIIKEDKELHELVKILGYKNIQI
jgi:hypothetical protein